MSDINRCVGWAQCSKCPRPEVAGPVPAGAEKARCAPRPVLSCPVAGAHCPPPRTCCDACGRLTHDCPEFLPYRCSAMPAINCSPNLPPSGWSVMSYKPSPAAYRSHPKNQMASFPAGACNAQSQSHRQRRRPCEARCLEAARIPLTLRYVPERPPMPPAKQPPCNPASVHKLTTTCTSLGTDRLNARVHFKFVYPGYEGTPSGRFVSCNPTTPCYQRTAFYNSGLVPRPPTINMATVPPSDN